MLRPIPFLLAFDFQVSSSSRGGHGIIQSREQQDEQHNLCSIVLHAPFFLVDHSVREGAVEAHTVLGITLSTLKLSHLELRGWKSQADNPEGLPGGVKEHMCLLACMDSCFLPVGLQECSKDGDGECTVKVTAV